MKKNKVSFAQAAELILDYAAGATADEVGRKYGITASSVCWWAKRYKGLSALWIQHIKYLERESHLMAVRCNHLTKHVLIGAEVITQFEPHPMKRSVIATALRAKYNLTRISANRIVGLSRTAGTEKSVRVQDDILILEMKRYFAENPGQGMQKLFQALLLEQPCTRARAWKAYKAAGLLIKDRPKKIRPPRRVLKPMETQGAQDQVWSMDFIVDALPDGKRFWVLSAIDDFNREALFTHVFKKTTTRGLVECLEKQRIVGRMSATLRSDNGGEFKGLEYRRWAKLHGVELRYARPNTPTDNAFAERFNGTLRREIFDRYSFETLEEVQRMLDDWRLRYNLSRPHGSLGGLSPLQYAQRVNSVSV